MTGHITTSLENTGDVIGTANAFGILQASQNALILRLWWTGFLDIHCDRYRHLLDSVDDFGDSGGICVGQDSNIFDDRRDMFVKLLVQYK